MISLVTGLIAMGEATSFESRYKAYAQCVQRNMEGFQIQSLTLLRDRALPHCRAERQKLVDQYVAEQRRGSLRERRRQGETAVTLLERWIPANPLDGMRVVPVSECASGVKEGDWCLK